jgi:hypothetical protein
MASGMPSTSERQILSFSIRGGYLWPLTATITGGFFRQEWQKVEKFTDKELVKNPKSGEPGFFEVCLYLKVHRA